MKRKIVMMFSLIFIISCCLLIGCTSEVTDKDVTITFQDKNYLGAYTGTCEGGIPNGQGEFKYKKDNNYLNYTGTFKDGKFSGKGELETSFLLVKFKEVDRIGEYKGDVVNGIPKGNGTFAAINDANVKYTHEGEWEDGIFNGKGTQKWDIDGDFTKVGNFEKGKFVPDFKDLLISFGTDMDMAYTVSDKANSFLANHSDLFPADSYEKLTPFINNTIEYKHLSKSHEQYGDQIVVMSGTVRQIFEDVKNDDSDKYSASEIFLSDENGNDYWIYYPGTCDVYEDDSVTIYGIPLDSSSFDNIGGGTTLVQVMAGCYIEH